MKRIDVLTLFPSLFGPFLGEGLLGRAVAEGLLEVTLVRLREHGLGKHRAVDGEPYGGGAGMVLRPEPLFSAVRERLALHAAAGRKPRVVLMTPQGSPFSQAIAREEAGSDRPLLLI